MLASIWLQLCAPQEQQLQALIDLLAQAHGTPPFKPHLTVCSPTLNPASWDAAAEYVRNSKLLPLVATKIGVSCSAETPFKAIVIDVANDAKIRTFREELRRITGAAVPEPPHVSILYGLDQRAGRPMASLDQSSLRRIADECGPGIAAGEFRLDRPVVVSPDGDWTNVKSWKVVRAL